MAIASESLSMRRTSGLYCTRPLDSGNRGVRLPVAPIAIGVAIRLAGGAARVGGLGAGTGRFAIRLAASLASFGPGAEAEVARLGASDAGLVPAPIRKSDQWDAHKHNDEQQFHGHSCQLYTNESPDSLHKFVARAGGPRHLSPHHARHLTSRPICAEIGFHQGALP